MTIPAYKIGDTVRTRGSLSGMTGTVTFYHAPTNADDHGHLEVAILTIDPEGYYAGDLWKVGDGEDIAIYHPDSEWYAKCGGGTEPEVITSAPDTTKTKTIHVLDDGETWSQTGYRVEVTPEQYARICAGEKPRHVVPDWDHTD